MIEALALLSFLVKANIGLVIVEDESGSSLKFLIS